METIKAIYRYVPLIWVFSASMRLIVGDYFSALLCLYIAVLIAGQQQEKA